MRIWLVALAVGCQQPIDPVDSADPIEEDPQVDPQLDTESNACAAGVQLDPGVGTSGFTPVVDGDPVYVETSGAQSFWHVPVAGAVAGTGQTVAVTPNLYWPGEDVALTSEDAVYIGLVGYDEETCAGTFYNVQAIIAPSFDPGMPWPDFICALMGEELELTLEVADLATGAATVAVTTLVARPHDSLECP